MLFPYSVRRTRWAFWILAPLNAAMILSTPSVGGHYLVDVIAGCLVAGISIMLVRTIRGRTARARLDWIGWLPGSLESVTGQKR